MPESDKTTVEQVSILKLRSGSYSVVIDAAGPDIYDTLDEVIAVMRTAFGDQTRG